MSARYANSKGFSQVPAGEIAFRIYDCIHFNLHAMDSNKTDCKLGINYGKTFLITILFVLLHVLCRV